MSRTNAADLLSVPLFVKRPGQRHGRVSDRYVRTIDILPTIADVIGAPLPWRSEGDSVFRQEPRTRLSIRDNFSSHVLVVGASEFARSRDAAVRRQARLFGSPLEPSRLFRVGPESALIGRPISAFETAPGRHAVTVRGLPDLRQYHPSSRTVPVAVEGELSGVGAGQDVAIGLNGRVVGTTRTFTSWSGTPKLFTIVPPKALRPGDNRLEVFAITTVKGGRHRLERFKLSG